MRDIGKNIKELRQLKNMTQDELAEKLFVTRQTISNYETGKSRPDIEMLTRIAETLETDPNTVLYGIPQQVNRERRILKLCISIAVFVVVWLVFCRVSDYAKEIGATTYDMGLSIVCRIFGGPAVAFLFGWTAMQALGVLAKLSPLADPWAKRLRWITLVSVAGYFLMLIPVAFSYLLRINLGEFTPHFLWRIWSRASLWAAGYVYGMHVRPSTVLFGILGCAFWLGIPQKKNDA